jgi:tetratricopeptide (TPR) repeat protein
MFNILRKNGKPIDHLKKMLRKHQEAEADTLVDIGISFIEEENFDEADKYLRQALRTCRELDDKEREAFVLNLIGDTYLGVRKIDEALEYYKDAFRLYSQVGSSLKKEMFEKIKEVEDIEEAIGIVEKEKKTLPQIKDVYEEYVGDYGKITSKLEEVIKMLETASSIYEKYSEEDAMEHLKEAFNVSCEIEDRKGKATLLLMIGNLLLKEEKSHSALSYFKDAFDIFYEIGDKKGEAVSLILIGAAYFTSGDLKKMADVFRKSIKAFQKLGDKYGESVAIDVLNTLYNEQQ